MTVSVVAALRGSGGLNAGTPLATASTPVRATDPLAKARSTQQDRHGLERVGSARDRIGYGAPAPSNTTRNVPSPIISRAEPTNR